MKSYLLLSVLVLLFVGGALTSVPSLPGQPVADDEVKHAMGSACYDPAILKTKVCYGGRCSDGGCGCVDIQQFMDGSFTLAPPTLCQTSKLCYTPQEVSVKNCSGS